MYIQKKFNNLRAHIETSAATLAVHKNGLKPISFSVKMKKRTKRMKSHAFKYLNYIQHSPLTKLTIGVRLDNDIVLRVT